MKEMDLNKNCKQLIRNYKKVESSFPIKEIKKKDIQQKERVFRGKLFNIYMYINPF